MYTIKQAALRSGLPIPTVRAWERRYGVVRPVRTSGGYRLYDDGDIERLSAMRRLVEVDGVRPSQAADEIRAAGALADGVGAEGSPPPAIEAEASNERVAAFLDAARAMDVAAMERVLDESFAAERFEAATASVVYPALRGIGEAWAAGAIDVAIEHAASETIRRRLARFYDATGDLGPPFEVIVGLAPGCHHEIGALGFAVAARRHGLSLLYLGANVPVASWLRTIEITGAAVVVIGAVLDADAPAAAEVVDALSESIARSTIIVGGAAAPEVATRTGALVLPAALTAAVEMVDLIVRVGADGGR
jgi:methanogenic corrinoid protein MtbC1